MSAIGFYIDGNEAHLRGSERDHARHLVMAFATPLFLDLLKFHRRDDLLAKFRTPIPDWVQRHERNEGKSFEFLRDLRLWLENDSPSIEVCGEPIGYGELALNTALVAGSPTLRLLAYLSGSCEDHAYFGPPHGSFIDAVEIGLRHRILNADAGWERVLALLKRMPAEVVVTDYSVSESWPPADWLDDFPGWESAEEGNWLEENRDKLHGRCLTKLLAADWPVDFAPHLVAEDPQGYLSGRSVFDLRAELYG